MDSLVRTIGNSRIPSIEGPPKIGFQITFERLISPPISQTKEKANQVLISFDCFVGDQFPHKERDTELSYTLLKLSITAPIEAIHEERTKITAKTAL